MPQCACRGEPASRVTHSMTADERVTARWRTPTYGDQAAIFVKFFTDRNESFDFERFLRRDSHHPARPARLSPANLPRSQTIARESERLRQLGQVRKRSGTELFERLRRPVNPHD